MLCTKIKPRNFALCTLHYALYTLHFALSAIHKAKNYPQPTFLKVCREKSGFGEK